MVKNKKIETTERVLVFCAHPDDEIFGVGGTIAKYAKQGIPVTAIILSYGEDSHPWLQRKVTVKNRVRESKAAGEVIGYNETIFMGLKVDPLPKLLKKRKVERRIKEIILKKQPTKIFVHEIQDSHKAHRAVYNAVMSALDKLKYNCAVYTFGIWTPFAFIKKNVPILAVDIRDTFMTKIKALNKFRSQKITLFFLLPVVYLGAIINGFNYNYRFAEVFQKVR